MSTPTDNTSPISNTAATDNVIATAVGQSLTDLPPQQQEAAPAKKAKRARKPKAPSVAAVVEGTASHMEEVQRLREQLSELQKKLEESSNSGPHKVIAKKRSSADKSRSARKAHFSENEQKRRGNFGPLTKALSDKWKSMTPQEQEQILDRFRALPEDKRKLFAERMEKGAQKAHARLIEKGSQHEYKSPIGADGVPLKSSFKLFMKLESDNWNGLRTSADEKKATQLARLARAKELKAKARQEREAAKEKTAEKMEVVAA